MQCLTRAPRSTLLNKLRHRNRFIDLYDITVSIDTSRLDAYDQWEKGFAAAFNACRLSQPMGRSIRLHNARAAAMVKNKAAGRPGRKAPDGEKKQFLTSMDPGVIRRIKAEAALRDKTAS
jgi:hypothetical protein